MFKLLIGAALGFAAAAWFMGSEDGAQKLALVKEKATGIAGKAKGVTEGESDVSATAGEPSVETEPTSAPEPETSSRP